MTQDAYRAQMHRVYRAVRGRLTQRVSPLDEEFPAMLLADFREHVKALGLKVPGA